MPRSKVWEDVDGEKFDFEAGGGKCLIFLFNGEVCWACTPEDAIDIGTELVNWGRENKK